MLSKTTLIPEGKAKRSLRTSLAISLDYLYGRYKPNCLTTFWTQITYPFILRTVKPLEPCAALG